MSYQKQNFANGEVLTAPQLNHIEDGIVDVESAVNENKGVVDKIIDPTLSLSGKAADAAKTGEAVNAESERAKGVENQLKEDIMAPYASTEPSGSAFGTGGNMQPNNRIKSNKLRAFKGDRVKCTDYVNYKFYVDEFDKSGSNLLYGGNWMQSDHVIKNSGQCVIYIAKKK